MIANSKVHCRWFRFSLRTLFALVTLVSIAMGYLGWQLRIIQERRLMARTIIDRGGQVWVGLSDLEAVLFVDARKISEEERKFMVFDPLPDFQIPWTRQQLGDVPVFYVFAAPAEIAAAKKVFPEAIVLPSDGTSVSGPFGIRPIDPFEDRRPDSWK